MFVQQSLCSTFRASRLARARGGRNFVITESLRIAGLPVHGGPRHVVHLARGHVMHAKATISREPGERSVKTTLRSAEQALRLALRSAMRRELEEHPFGTAPHRYALVDPRQEARQCRRIFRRKRGRVDSHRQAWSGPARERERALQAK